VSHSSQGPSESHSSGEEILRIFLASSLINSNSPTSSRMFGCTRIRSFSVIMPTSSPFERTGSLRKLSFFIFCKACEMSAEGFITATFLAAMSIALISLKSMFGFFVIVQSMFLAVRIPRSFLLSSVTRRLLTRCFTSSFAHIWSGVEGLTAANLRVIMSPTAILRNILLWLTYEEFSI